MGNVGLWGSVDVVKVINLMTVVIIRGYWTFVSTIKLVHGLVSISIVHLVETFIDS